MARFMVLAHLLIYLRCASGIIKIPNAAIGMNTKNYETNNRNSQLINFFAGGFAGTVASTLTAPLEIVKTQLQGSRIGGGKTSVVNVVKKILQEDGVAGFYKGLQPLLIGIIPTRAIYFWAYDGTKKRLAETPLGNSAANHLASAFSAGIVSNTITNPIWMVKTRFQLLADQSVGQRKFTSYRDVIKTIYREEGPLGFFKGMSASYLGCFEGGIQWILYEKLKTAISLSKQRARSITSAGESRCSSDRGGSDIKAGEYFAAAAVSKFAAICITYPHEVVRTRLREQASNGAFKYKGLFDTLKIIANEEGRRGLYGGMGMHLLRSVPNSAIMFVTFELVSDMLKKRAMASSAAPGIQ